MKKIRVCLSLDPKIVNKVDSIVDGIIIKSRSEAVERILKEHIVDKKTAVVLAGGEPGKLFIKELDTYRPLVKIGKNTLIEETIMNCRKAGFDNIIIIGFASLIAKLYEILGDGTKYGVSITYVEEKKELGSAKTLELAKNYLKNDFLFLACDFYFDFDIKKLLEFHR